MLQYVTLYSFLIKTKLIPFLYHKNCIRHSILILCLKLFKLPRERAFNKLRPAPTTIFLKARHLSQIISLSKYGITEQYFIICYVLLQYSLELLGFWTLFIVEYSNYRIFR
jgi:hypothetical protein